MATYIILNLAYLAIVSVGLILLKAFYWSRASTVALAVILILTAVFDSLLIALEVFAYSPELILGLQVGLAPVEDFFYAALAVVVVPSLWNYLERKKL